MNKNTKNILLWSGFTIIAGALLYGGYILTKKAFKMGQLVLKLAEKYNGEKEKSGNQGFYNPELETLLKSYGWSIGQPYCAYFTRAMMAESHPDKKDVLRKILQGGTQLTWSNAKNDKTGTVITTDKPTAGDVVIWQSYKNGVPAKNASGGTIGHAGIVKRVNTNDFVTIEGNTGATGGREGDGIYEKTRNYSWNTANGLRLKGFIHLV